MEKAPEAFRTISEVAEWLDTPAHVLRFWESKFTQLRPVKRAGGRRYYRPEDMSLLAGIKTLLHDQGMTIKGVQKILREQGVRHVSSLGPALPGGAPAAAADPAPDLAELIEGPEGPGQDTAEFPPSDPAATGPAHRRDGILAALARARAPRALRKRARLAQILDQLVAIRGRLASG